jgi:carbon monoxide dehydrogenase subunit G
VHIEGVKRFAATRERVWDALVDPELLARFLPGVQSLDVYDEAHWAALMKLPHSPVSLTVEFELRERNRPERALLEARGKRFGASVHARTSFDLAAGDPDATEMAWSADIDFGGALKRVTPMLRPVAQQQAERFLDRLDRRLSDGASPE